MLFLWGYMRWGQYLKFFTAVILTALALVATATQSVRPTAGRGVNLESRRVVGGNLLLQGTYSEARNGGGLLSVWRGATNGIIKLT
jgi:hypothetical protein